MRALPRCSSVDDAPAASPPLVYCAAACCLAVAAIGVAALRRWLATELAARPRVPCPISPRQPRLHRAGWAAAPHVGRVAARAPYIPRASPAGCCRADHGPTLVPRTVCAGFSVGHGRWPAAPSLARADARGGCALPPPGSSPRAAQLAERRRVPGVGREAAAGLSAEAQPASHTGRRVWAERSPQGSAPRRSPRHTPAASHGHIASSVRRPAVWTPPATPRRGRRRSCQAGVEVRSPSTPASVLPLAFRNGHVDPTRHGHAGVSVGYRIAENSGSPPVRAWPEGGRVWVRSRCAPVSRLDRCAAHGRAHCSRDGEPNLAASSARRANLPQPAVACTIKFARRHSLAATHTLTHCTRPNRVEGPYAEGREMAGVARGCSAAEVHVCSSCAPTPQVSEPSIRSCGVTRWGRRRLRDSPLPYGPVVSGVQSYPCGEPRPRPASRRTCPQPVGCRPQLPAVPQRAACAPPPCIPCWPGYTIAQPA